MVRSTPSSEPKKAKKTAAQKATEALGVEQRRVDKLEKQIADLTAEAKALEPQLAAAKAQRDYLAQNPALPENQPDATPADTTAGREVGSAAAPAAGSAT